MTNSPNTAKQAPELDICVSANSNLIHIEEKVTGRNIATMTMKGGTREEKIALALQFAAAPELLEAAEAFDAFFTKMMEKQREDLQVGWLNVANLARAAIARAKAVRS